MSDLHEPTTDLRGRLARAPKVVLHDHLDGGLRASTLLELADEIGHELPESTPEALAAWVQRQADSGSLAAFLEPFSHTTAVLQTPHALERVARESVLDLAADGVVVMESRFAPELSTAGGLSIEEVLDAVLAGLHAGAAEAADAGRPIRVGAIVCAMRQADRSLEAARAALSRRDAGVVGFDIAGLEIGFPATDHADAFALLRENLLPFTVHAGEAVGPESVAQALAVGASRLGHGVRVLEDVTVGGDDASARPHLGRVASYVRDRQVPLEVCPRSNTQTGTSPSIAGHQVTALRDLGFTITLSSDDRLWTGTTLTDEMVLLAEEAGWGWDDFRQVTLDALDAAFIGQDERMALLEHVVLPGWAD
ncbi:adenosine deaminase [Quadrisphaera setariae]|uniref:adenosine deaminase n=1 Tax=Quadrisphaera setariae TaxID=2593304 RepID=A0A5C8ZLE2_9ACTN|nr:adenosine deaminase [Quadrisphaera setariae]TXR57928.1 adenosine deaminase [Quadrisphaera setariae]